MLLTCDFDFNGWLTLDKNDMHISMEAATLTSLNLGPWALAQDTAVCITVNFSMSYYSVPSTKLWKIAKVCFS